MNNRFKPTLNLLITMIAINNRVSGVSSSPGKCQLWTETHATIIYARSRVLQHVGISMSTMLIWGGVVWRPRGQIGALGVLQQWSSPRCKTSLRPITPSSVQFKVRLSQCCGPWVLLANAFIHCCLYYSASPICPRGTPLKDHCGQFLIHQRLSLCFPAPHACIYVSLHLRL